MHPCLNVDEILRLIAYKLVASGGKWTAVGLACCCKSFEDPVLDMLHTVQQFFPHDPWAIHRDKIPMTHGPYNVVQRFYYP